ncbi:Aquaporin TIP1-2 [Capsicum annuum]|uniref:Aquaporin TIP1-2 n=1 Tax=Capsicum annuum TaxID=4072 RepID=A0A2G2YGB5_CAPAN|nr:Aquaporin TIP1-2 [Capsicum annuum]PHT68759.1 Aquaporin TIP1-2 [Capsicum annuum]
MQLYLIPSDPKRGNMGIIGPIAIHLVCGVGANILSGGAHFGAVMNPTMAFCQAVISWTWTNYWVYCLDYFIGAAIAALVYQTIFIGHNTHE